MKIEQINLKNYRQYRDVTIVFSTSDDESLTVIEGANGAGKTNLLNAVTWCLYGREKHLEKKYKGLPLINTATLGELESGKRCGVEVKILMRGRDGKKITVVRSQEFQKLKGHQLQEIGNLKFRVFEQVGKEVVSVEDPGYKIGGLIPESIEEYFFFDGEKLNEYFRSTSGEKIRDAVFKISQLGLLENAIKHLGSKKNDFLKREKDLSPRVKEIKDELTELEELYKDHKQELGRFRRDRKEAEEKGNEFSEKLRASPVENIGALEEERGEVRNALSALEENLEGLEQERLDYLIEMSPLIFAYEPITEMKRMIERGEEAGDIPPDYKRSFLEKLLKKGRCVCGTDISGDNGTREEIAKLLQGCSEISDISVELIKEDTSLKLLMGELESFREEQISHGKKIKLLENDRKRRSEEEKKLTEKIGSSDSESVRGWERKLAEYRKLERDLSDKIADRKFYTRDTEKEINNLTGELNKELKKEEKHASLVRNLNFCDKSLSALEKIKNEIMEDVRKEIEEKTEKQFFSLIWKKGTYKNVRIDENYNISVMDVHGMEGIGTLSAGERQVLALSFIAALNSVSGFDAPIIIDTPLGRISKEPKRNIASNLLNYLKGKQVTLLVTEEEYTPEVREKLSKRVGRECKINFRETGERAEVEVEPYGIWKYKK